MESKRGFAVWDDWSVLRTAQLSATPCNQYRPYLLHGRQADPERGSLSLDALDLDLAIV